MEATRTLVKSPPELWAEVSDVAALTRHLGEFGEIRIVRAEPEAVVEWEGDLASGTVRLEPAGWGTRVTLTVEPTATIEPPSPADSAESASPTDAAESASPPAAVEPVPPADPAESASPTGPAVPAPPTEAAGTPSAAAAEAAPADEPAEPEAAAPEPDRVHRRGFFARLLRRFRRRLPAEPQPLPRDESPLLPPDAPPLDPPEAPPVDPPQAPPVDTPEAPPVDPPQAPPVDPPGEPALAGIDSAAVLGQALDALGSAHHRPFSR